MGLLDKLKGEFIDIIEWTEDDAETIAYRFERYGNEIKNGAKLTVREGQTAVFVNEGQIADIFEPGMYELTTENLPLLSTLKGWKYGFNSPFKAEVIFISTREITGFGWGTPGPFRMRDPEFGILELTARGHFSFHVMDPVKFIRKVVGTEGDFTKEEIEDRLRKKFVTEAISGIAEMNKSFYDMAQHFDEISEMLKERVDPTFLDRYGIGLDDTSIQSIDLTERSAEKVEKRDDMFFATDRMGMYERKARADAMLGLAGNEGAGGGAAASGMGLGMGMAMAGQMGGMYAAGQPQPPAGGMAPPPPPPAGFFLYINGQQTGPLGIPQIQQMVAGGQVTAQTQVWRQGMSGWMMLQSVPELAALLRSGGATPPPLPPM